MTETANGELPYTPEQIREAIDWLAAHGLIYDSGQRRAGQIVWRATPGKEKEAEALLGEPAAQDNKREE